MESVPSSSQIYTDSSQINSGVGIFIIYNDLSTPNKLLECNSIYNAEFIALFED